MPTALLLTADEERELAARIAAGDGEARHELIVRNLGLVHTVAGDFVDRGLSLDDLVGEGNLGLIRAADEFRAAFGTRFSTYATYWIREAIFHGLYNRTRLIRVPAHVEALLRRWRRAAVAISRTSGTTPTFDEVADSLGLTAKSRCLAAAAFKANRVVPTQRWMLARASTAESSVDDADGLDWMVRQISEQLEPRERSILIRRYGLDGREPESLREIAARFGRSREWVRYVERRAPDKLLDVA